MTLLTTTLGEVSVDPQPHPDCTKCCLKQRCHFCAGLTPAIYIGEWNGHLYYACGVHKQTFLDSMGGRCRSPSYSPQGDHAVTCLDPFLR